MVQVEEVRRGAKEEAIDRRTGVSDYGIYKNYF